MPIFGKWVSDLLARGEQQLQRWKWRASEGDDDAASRGSDWGSSVSWRFGESAEFNNIVEEKEGMVKARAKL